MLFIPYDRIGKNIHELLSQRSWTTTTEHDNNRQGELCEKLLHAPPQKHTHTEKLRACGSGQVYEFQWPNTAFVFCDSTAQGTSAIVTSIQPAQYHWLGVTHAIIVCLHMIHPIFAFHSFRQSGPKSLDLPLSCTCILKTIMQLGFVPPKLENAFKMCFRSC